MQIKQLFCLATAFAATGCAADYLNNYDSATLASGDANRANQLLQTVDPFNPNSNNTHIEGDGQRAVGVVQRYRGIPSMPATPSALQGGGGRSPGNHPCDQETQLDSMGRPCGGRAAEAKPGGRTGYGAE